MLKCSMPRCFPPSSRFPSDPLAQPASHDPLEIFALEPRDFLGKHRHAFAIGAREPREIAAPEHALRTERVVRAPYVRMERAKRIRIGRVARQAARLYGDVRQWSELEQL